MPPEEPSALVNFLVPFSMGCLVTAVFFIAFAKSLFSKDLRENTRPMPEKDNYDHGDSWKPADYQPPWEKYEQN